MPTIYRRGKTWWFRAQRKGKEVRRSLETGNREVAERRARQIIDELVASAWGEKRYTFLQAAERFINEHLTILKPLGAKRYGVSLKQLSVHFGDKMLSEITRGSLSEYESRRRAQGVSPSSIRRDIACLSSLLTSAEDWEWIEDGRNEARTYLRRRAKRGLKEGDPRTRYLTEAEEAALLGAASADVADAMALAIDTGLRREELFSLTWQQVDLLRGTITTTTDTKNGRKRKVPVTARSAQILSHLPRSLTSHFVLINPDTDKRYVQRNKGLKAAMRRAGLADLRWHDLRRTAGCRWLQRDGKSMEEVCTLLGHYSVLVTEKHYAFLEADTVAGSAFDRTRNGTGTADIIQLSSRTKS